jgi:hypothetical protein
MVLTGVMVGVPGMTDGSVIENLSFSVLLIIMPLTFVGGAL